MHCIISSMFDCWADPFVHLLVRKNSMSYQIKAVGPLGRAQYNLIWRNIAT